MIDMLAMGQQILASQPFSVFLGTQLTAFNDEQVELHLLLRDELKQQNGFAHGGVLSYLADNALTFAGGAKLGPAVLTAEYKINYMRPAVGSKLIARASDPGAERLLRRYAVQHRLATLPLYEGTRQLVKLYTNDRLLARPLRAGVLRLGALPPVRRMMGRLLSEARPA